MGRDLSDRSHLLCLQSSSVLVPQWKDVPRDCFLLQDLNFLPSLSLRLTPTGFLTTSEVLVFLLLPGFLSSIFLPPHPILPWILSLSKEMAGTFMLQLLPAPWCLPDGETQHWSRFSFLPAHTQTCRIGRE